MHHGGDLERRGHVRPGVHQQLDVLGDWDWVTGTADGTYLVREALEKEIPSLMLSKRAAILGNRAARLGRMIDARTGQINSLDNCSCVLNWADGKVTSITYRTTLTEEESTPVPSHTPIGDGFILKNPHLDYEAALEKPPARYLVHQLFLQGVGPNKFLLGKKATALQVLAQEALQDRIKAASPATVGAADVLTPSKAAKQSARIGHLKAKLQVASQAAKRRKTISLKGSAEAITLTSACSPWRRLGQG